jgi:two-component system heavy metal sensor histidine kinase CusS
MYLAMVKVLYDAESQFINDEINIVRNLLETKLDDHSALNQEVVEIPNTLLSSAYHYYIRVLDENNRIVAQTPNMDKYIPASNFYNISDQKIHSSFSHNTHYLLSKSRVATRKDNKNWLIQLGLDVTYQQVVIEKYRRWIMLLLFMGGLTSMLFGYMISRRGMRYLNDLTETTEKIAANALQKRIDLKSFPHELVRLGEAYNKMLHRIEVSISHLTDFSDNLAHELRTPITILMGEAEMVLSRTSSLEDYRRVIESSMEELENTQIELNKSIINVNDEIGSICRFYQSLADEKNIQVSAEGEATMLANSVMFRRMINNLLSNALKYSGFGGHIKILVEENKTNTVQITIKDTGIGIAEENLQHLFDRFYRADNARAHSPGSGLGLAIVKAIVDLHQGSINVADNLPNGTMVTLTFPM